MPDTLIVILELRPAGFHVRCVAANGRLEYWNVGKMGFGVLKKREMFH
jgi:hypothetical protein